MTYMERNYQHSKWAPVYNLKGWRILEAVNDK